MAKRAWHPSATRLCAVCVGCGLILAVLAVSPSARAHLQQVFFGLTPLSDAELEDQRAGFRTAGGLELNIGAVVRTTVDGRKVLEARMTLARDGWRTSRWVSTAEGVRDLRVAGPPPDMDLARGLDGVVVRAGDGGRVTALHQIDLDRIQNLVINRGRGRTVRQNVTVKITATGYESFREALQTASATGRAGAAIRRATRDALNR